MKTKKIIFGLSFLAIATVCTINVQSSLSMSDELGYASLADLITLNSALAEVGGHNDCIGRACNEVQGNSRGDDTSANGVTKCCAAELFSSGRKKL